MIWTSCRRWTAGQRSTWFFHVLSGKNRPGDYSSDYHRLNKNKSDHWTFEVRGNQTGTLRLRWEATSPEALARGQLVDEETGTIIAAADVDHYEFTLNGAARKFRWEYLASNGKPAK